MVTIALQTKLGNAIVIPRVRTIARYGLSVSEWLAILTSQGGRCAICRGLPASGKFCIDHEHVKGWKRMTSQERKRFVRGVVCYPCNHHCLNRNMTLDKAKGVVEYLTRYGEKNQTLFS